MAGGGFHFSRPVDGRCDAGRDASGGRRAGNGRPSFSLSAGNGYSFGGRGIKALVRLA